MKSLKLILIILTFASCQIGADIIETKLEISDEIYLGTGKPGTSEIFGAWYRSYKGEYFPEDNYTSTDSWQLLIENPTHSWTSDSITIVADLSDKSTKYVICDLKNKNDKIDYVYTERRYKKLTAKLKISPILEVIKK
jgi:hypothetical protein